MKLRSYTPADKEACLAIFDSNTPPYFAKHERPEFAAFLDESRDPYFVVEASNGQIIGCGGYFRFRVTIQGCIKLDRHLPYSHGSLMT
jgi:hypothetical protein